jgi:hypothetical protein
MRRPTPNQKRQIDAALRTLEPAIERAFREAIASIAGAVDIGALVEAITAGRIEDAVQILRINQAVLFPLTEAIRGSYMVGGGMVAASLPFGARAVFGFDGNHPRAIEWSRAMSAEKITAISQETIANARTIITAGIERNAGSQAIARDLVGRKIGATRVGGMIGPNNQQLDQILRARQMLSDPARISEYFVRNKATGKLVPRYKTSDRRYDKIIKQAIADGRALSPADVARVTEAHTQKAITLRGKTIAENEAHTALAAGREDGYRQLIDSGVAEEVTVRWQHNLTEKAREDHQAMDGTVIQLGETFSFADAQMKHPHDPAGGARHSVGCNCIAVYRVKVAKD